MPSLGTLEKTCTHPLRNSHAADFDVRSVHLPRDRDWAWRMHAERFLEDSMYVGKVGDGRDGDIPLAFECLPDFLNESFHDRRVLQSEVGS